MSSQPQHQYRFSSYRGQPIDLSVPISASRLLSIPTSRPGRLRQAQPIDSHSSKFYGDTVIQKAPNTTRIFFQNVKGLTHTTSQEDYRYYISCIKGLSTDIAGLSETNACWSHSHLRSDFRAATRRFYKQSKAVFGSPTRSIDPCSPSETFQAGGNLTLITGCMASRATGQGIEDETGLGRWSGVTLEGQDGHLLTIITAYRVCSGSPSTAPLGSSFLREYEFLRRTKSASLNPRRRFLVDLKTLILDLQDLGHAIILMLDANSTMDSDTHFADFVFACGLQDAHSQDPAPSTYIGSATRRIDFILCCEKVSPHIVRSGTLSYSEGPQSDHRGLYIDISEGLLSRPKWSTVTPQSQRDLHTGNPELVLRYQSAMVEYYSQHNMVERITDLYHRHTTMSREELRELLIKWDNDQGRAMQHSERILSRPQKKHAWSPALRNSAIIRRYWYLRLREITRGENFESTFLRWQSQLQRKDASFHFPYLGQSLTIEQIREYFNRSNRLFRKNQSQATPLRLQMYYDLLATYEDDTDPSTKGESRRKARIVKNTLDGESTRSTFSNIRRVVKPSEISSLSKVKIPINTLSTYSTLQEQSPDDLIWETVVNRHDLEKHIAAYNRDSFRAASESPCGHGIVHDALTYTSLSPAAAALLRKEIPPDWYGDDFYLQEFLASFAIPPCVKDRDPIDTFLTESDVLKGFQSWKETTSTSPSGRHLGHYKSLVQHPLLLDCFVKFMNIVIARGIAVPRWCNATSVMIEKDAGNPRIHRLRIIHLFEADFNFFLKIQWGHRLLRRAVELDLLHDSQHGSTPGKTTMDPIMLNQLTADLCRILKHDLARFDNDASACYDRIIVALGMLAARRCGMPHNAIKLHSEALQFMRYTVKTVYGVSEINYAGTEFEPLFGTGQRSGASPAVWLSMVVVLLHTLDRIIPDRMNFDPILSGSPHSRLCDAFVDDTSVGFTSSNETETLEGLISRLQRVAQTWEHLLYLSGGKLNLSKCSWYVLRWEWQNGRPCLQKIRPIDPKLSLVQGSMDQPVEIRRTAPDVSSKMLGILLNPLGDFTDHLQLLKTKADNFARRLLSPRITASDAAIFHRSIYIPSMRYSLAALAVDEEALGAVQTRVIQSILQKMHYSSKLPTSIRHGPVEMGGLGIYDLRTEAGLEALKFFRNSIYSHTETGKLLRLNMEYSQREAGIGEHLMQFPGIQLPYLTPSWILSLRQYLSMHNMHIVVTDIHVDPLHGHTDQYIMDTTHLQRYSVSQQRDINLVRMYLQVSTLADLVDSSAPTRIDLSLLDARRKQSFVSSTKWPRQAVPTAHQRRLWKRYISSSYLRYIPYWQNPSPPLKPPCDENVPDMPPPASLKASIKSLPRTQRRLLDGLEQVATDPQVARAFRSRAKLHLASDGGLAEGKATHGWVLSTKKHILFRCSGPVDGPTDLNSSTRSELGGCASALTLLVSVSRTWGGIRPRCSFRWYTDSRSAITRIKKHAVRGSRSRQLPHDADLLAIIQTMLKELRRPFALQWVKAHQDELVSYNQLPLAARLNIDADFLATRYRLSGRLKQSHQVDHQPSQQCSFYINGIPVVSQFDASVRFHVNGYHYRRHVQEKNGWSDVTWKMIDFHNFGHHLKRLSPGHRSHHLKSLHDHLPLGQRRYREAKVKNEDLKLCPCCRSREETPLHLLLCTDNPDHLTSLATLKSDMLTNDIHPVRYLLYDGIHHWSTMSDDPFDPQLTQYPPHFQPLLSRALEEQSQIGWEFALKGYLSNTWSLIAQQGMDSPSHDLRNGEKRIRSILTSIYSHTRRIWLSRNSVLHSHNDSTLADIRSQEIAEIKFYHSRPELLLSADQHLCQRSLSRLLSGSSSTRRRWLSMVKRSSIDMTKDGTRQSRITSFFAPLRPN